MDLATGDWQEVVGNLARWSFSHEVKALALSPDGELVACALDPGQVLVWKVSEGRIAHRLDLEQIEKEPFKALRTHFAGGRRFLVVVHSRRYFVFDLVRDERILDVAAVGLQLSSFFVGEGEVVAFSGSEAEVLDDKGEI